jgi:hypothetical protein
LSPHRTIGRCELSDFRQVEETPDWKLGSQLRTVGLKDSA